MQLKVSTASSDISRPTEASYFVPNLSANAISPNFLKRIEETGQFSQKAQTLSTIRYSSTAVVNSVSLDGGPATDNNIDKGRISDSSKLTLKKKKSKKKNNKLSAL